MVSSASTPILSTGELLWDLLPSGPRIGGTTTNFAILCARLGHYSALVSRLGRDEFGDRALDYLNGVAMDGETARRLDLSWIQRSDTLPTGTVTVQLDAEGHPRYAIHEPVAWDEIVSSPSALELASRVSVLCFGTLAQRRSPSRESIRALVDATSPSCVRVCDVNLRMPFCTAATLEWVVERATVLKVSDEELPEVGRLLGLSIPANVPADGDRLTAWATEAAFALLQFAPQCRMVAITLGARGSLLARDGVIHRHAGFAVTVADTIGAGDAFTAGLVHSYGERTSLEQINTVSNLCGSYVASQPGATPPVPRFLMDRIDRTLADGR